MVSIVSIIIAILILSIKTSFILASSWLTKTQGFAVSIGFGILLFFLTMLAAPFTDILSYYIYQYTFETSVLIALFLIFLGLSNSKDRCNNKTKIKSSIVAFLPCPFCLGALSLAIIIASINFQVQLWKISLLAATVFAFINIGLIIIIRAAFINKGFDKAYVFDTLLIFIGTVTIVFSLFIPNFVKAAQMNFSPVIIESTNVVAVVIFTCTLIIALGYYLYLLRSDN